MKIDNIVVKNIDLDHSKEIINTFIDLGINNLGLKGSNADHAYYGVIDGRFNIYTEYEINRFKPKIITLEQLKSMKEDKSEYPKLMWVWNGSRGKKYKRVVFMEKNNNFIAWERADSIDGAKEVLDTHPWDYAQDIKEAPDPKQELKTKVEFTGSLCMGDFQKNTMTFEIEGDMTLQAGRYLISKID